MERSGSPPLQRLVSERNKKLFADPTDDFFSASTKAPQEGCTGGAAGVPRPGVGQLKFNVSGVGLRGFEVKKCRGFQV